MRWRTIFILWGGLILTLLFTLLLKAHVVQLMKERRTLQTEQQRLEEDMRVLQAESAFRQQPRVLRRWADAFGFRPVEPQHVVQDISSALDILKVK